MKKLLRKNNQELQQIIRRYAELDKACINITKKKENFFTGLKGLHKSGPILQNMTKGKQYKIFSTGCFTIDCDDQRNNSVLLHNKTAVRCNFIKTENGTEYMIGKKFLFEKDVFDNPVPSLDVDCFIGVELNELSMGECSEIKTKACVLPVETYFAIIPMQHFN